MQHPIFIEDGYGNHIYKANGKVLTDIKAVEIDGTRYDVTSRLVKVSVSEMGHRRTFDDKRYFIKYKNKETELYDLCWFDPEDEWFADEGPAEFVVRTIDVTF